MAKPKPFEIAGETLEPGESRDLQLDFAADLGGGMISVPIRVVRGREAGPVLLITGAIHGDELNGVGIIRRLMQDLPELKAGTLILAPVVNVLAFGQGSRYMPDRRDLNRCFPGLKDGSLTSRFASFVFQELARKADFCLDLHSASAPRTNFPNVRADLSNPHCERMARWLGVETILDTKGVVGTLRREACRAGIPTILLEAGETMKMEPTIAEYGAAKCLSLLRGLGLLEGEPQVPGYFAMMKKSVWVRAEIGGLLQFHVGPGELVAKGQALATSTTILGQDLGMIRSPLDGMVIGMTTSPAIRPGDAVAHVAAPKGGIRRIQKARSKEDGGHLSVRVMSDLATNMILSEPAE